MFRLIFCLGILFTTSWMWGEQTSQKSEDASLQQILNLIRGHQEFKKLHYKQHEDEFIRLVKEGQSPKTLFIGCSDSRVVPSLILNTRPGELFVIRTAGNFVPPYAVESSDGVSATLQYAVEELNVSHIIVCGHSHCGAIQGLFHQLPKNLDILERWLKWGEDAKKMVSLITKPSTPQDELEHITEEVSVVFQLEHLLTFPFVRSRVDSGKLILHGWYFDIERGELSYFDPEVYRFKPLSNIAMQNVSR